MSIQKAGRKFYAEENIGKAVGRILGIRMPKFLISIFEF